MGSFTVKDLPGRPLALRNATTIYFGKMGDKVNNINFTFTIYCTLTISESFRGNNHKTYCYITIATFRVLSKNLNYIPL